MPRDMQVVALSRYGAPQVLQPARRPIPDPAPGEVRIAIAATAINPADLKHRRGGYRPFTGWLRPTSTVSGFDVAGTVSAVGAGVTRFKEGDRVMTLMDVRQGGGYAQYLCADAALVAPVPDYLTLAEAAAMPLATITVAQALAKLALPRGARLLINGACGGIGALALQAACGQGLTVTAVGHRQNLALLRELGAARVIDYTAEDFSRRSEQWDGVLDVCGLAGFGRARRVLTRNGIYVTVQPRLTSLWDVLRARFDRRRWRMVAVFPSPENIALLERYLSEQTLHPVLDRSFPLTQAATAHRYYEQNVTRGRLLLTVDDAA